MLYIPEVRIAMIMMAGGVLMTLQQEMKQLSIGTILVRVDL
jgi:hypothetical protein